MTQAQITGDREERQVGICLSQRTSATAEDTVVGAPGGEEGCYRYPAGRARDAATRPATPGAARRSPAHTARGLPGENATAPTLLDPGSREGMGASSVI